VIKQTLYFGNPTYLKLKNRQLEIEVRKLEDTIKTKRPIEDIGVVILDHPRITITHQAIRALQSNNAVIISCDASHMPASLMIPYEGNKLQSKRYQAQINARLPLKKNLWQQTVVAKIENQIAVLRHLGKPGKKLEVLVKRVQSGDPENIEGQAAAYYWATFLEGFIRDQYGEPPNNLLNFGYAIIRSMAARALVGAGLIPTLGIHHSNQYNAFCLADDIMEPARPFVDLIVHNLFLDRNLESFLDKESKQTLLSVMTSDALFGKKRSPMLVGYNLTAASLAECYLGSKRRIKYPRMT
jgi:CRISPR-associated protein Cas1